MSRKQTRSKPDEKTQEKVRKMKEKQRQWMEERESAKRSKDSKTSSRSGSYLSESRSSDERNPKSGSLTWISKDDCKIAGTKYAVKTRQLECTRQSEHNSSKRNENNPLRVSAKSENSITGFDNGLRKSTKTPNSPEKRRSRLAATHSTNTSNSDAVQSFNNLADELAKKLEVKVPENDDVVNKNKKLMASHVCSGCHNLMAAPHLPVAIIPCGHTFCQACVSEYSQCPQCQAEVFSTAPNTLMQKIIEDFRMKQEKERLQQLEIQTRKYVEEYQSLNLRCEGLAEEADRILNSMESITEDILREKRVARKVEKQNTEIQEKIKELELQYSQNEELLRESSSNGLALEKNYESEKEKLTLIEETIKSIRNSKERAKLMIQNLAPNLILDDTF